MERAQSVELGDHEFVPRAHGREGLLKPGARTVGTSEPVVDVNVFLVDAERQQGLTLHGEVLLGGRDVCVSGFINSDSSCLAPPMPESI
jgi:hypothetical protein